MKRYQLIVVGGGIAGVAAAVSAAREGISVLLIEKFGSLGGTMTYGLVYPFMGYTMDDGNVLLSDGIFTEMRVRKEAYRDTSWESYKFVFDDMVTESGVDVLFHAVVFEIERKDRKLTSVSITTKSGVLKVEADFFVDCSGDGELFAMAGCAYQLGRESDGYCQPMTTCFRVSGVDMELFDRDRSMILKKYKEYCAKNIISNPRDTIQMVKGLGEGILHFNAVRVIKYNPVDPVEISRAEILGRKRVYELFCFLKECSGAFAHSTIISIASHIGVRESRKLKGRHILTGEELKSCMQFGDVIAYGNYAIDIHHPTGIGTEIFQFEKGQYYQIPYRSLLPTEYDNMLVAGRCLSATHEAHSAVRIMPICACLGEAAGLACAVAYHTGANVHTVDIGVVQAKLRRNGEYQNL